MAKGAVMCTYGIVLNFAIFHMGHPGSRQYVK